MPRTHPCVAPIFAQDTMSITEIAGRSGVCRGAIAEWRNGTNPHLTNLDAALAVIGLRLAIEPILTQPLQFMRRR